MTASVSVPASRFGRVGAMTESESALPVPGKRVPGKQPAADALAAKLLAVQRLLSALDVEPDVRLRLHLRYMAICTSLKLPAANRTLGALRLDQLMADAERAKDDDRQGRLNVRTERANRDEKPGVN
jgi:hypothetical protein